MTGLLAGSGSVASDLAPSVSCSGGDRKGRKAVKAEAGGPSFRDDDSALQRALILSLTDVAERSKNANGSKPTAECVCLHRLSACHTILPFNYQHRYAHATWGGK